MKAETMAKAIELRCDIRDLETSIANWKKVEFVPAAFCGDQMYMPKAGITKSMFNLLSAEAVATLEKELSNKRREFDDL